MTATEKVNVAASNKAPTFTTITKSGSAVEEKAVRYDQFMTLIELFRAIGEAKLDHPDVHQAVQALNNDILTGKMTSLNSETFEKVNKILKEVGPKIMHIKNLLGSFAPGE